MTRRKMVLINCWEPGRKSGCGSELTVPAGSVWLFRIDWDEPDEVSALAEVLFTCPKCGATTRRVIRDERLVAHTVAAGVTVSMCDPAARHPSKRGRP